MNKQLAKQKSEALSRAITAAGGVTALARKLKISKQAVSAWDEVPLTRLIAIERITEIPRGELRPDLAELFS